MAKNITLLGASYPDVPAILLPQTGGGTARFDDASVTTAAASDVASGKVFLASDGTITAGTASGGGGSNWTLLGSKELSANTTSTTQTNLGTIPIGTLPSGDYVLWVTVRDKAGPRNGYFYGTDSFFWVRNGVKPTNANPPGYTTRYTNDAFSMSTTIRGVYCYNINSNDEVQINVRYASSTSGTINGTYKCEVYKLTTPMA